jgi:aspartate semialdehyde dehydrogenase (EC 1.2.1.11)
VKRRVAILGATGLVGQRFVSLLSKHPWFKIVLLVGSERNYGRKYKEVVKWVLEEPLPQDLGDMVLEKLEPGRIMEEHVDIVFSALPSEVAVDVEVELAKKGVIVVSNASPMRMEPDIPLLNPEVNADHIELLELQRRIRGWSGGIVKVPNCTTSILTLSLKPIVDEYGVRRVIVSSMQAISGAGLNGLPAMIIADNLVPFIEGEEEKVEKETIKIMGELKESGVVPRNEIKVSASCHRVNVLEGHTLSVFVELDKRASVEELIKTITEFKTNKIKDLQLPTAPLKPIIVREENDRPQPRLDRYESGGMSVVIGRIRYDEVIGGVKYIVLGHNTIRGAAGNGVLIAELLVAKGLA